MVTGMLGNSRQSLSKPPYLLQGLAAPHQGEGKKRRGTSKEQVGAGEKKSRDFSKSFSRQLLNKRSGWVVEVAIFYPSSSCLCDPQ